MAIKSGLTPVEFWNLSWWEWDCIANAYNEKEENEWRRVRQVVTMLYNVNVTKRSQLKKPEEIMPLPNDNIYKLSVSPQEREKMYLTMVKLHNEYLERNGRCSGVNS